MSSVVHNIVFDCDSPYELAHFWSKGTGKPLAADDFPGRPGGVHRSARWEIDPSLLELAAHGLVSLGYRLTIKA
jgi:hypothetical protein